MKFSDKVLRCQQSTMRKFHPYAVAAAAAGKKIYHLNIGQPDIHTPDQLFEAIRSFQKCLPEPNCDPAARSQFGTEEGANGYRAFGVSRKCSPARFF